MEKNEITIEVDGSSSHSAHFRVWKIVLSMSLMGFQKNFG